MTQEELRRLALDYASNIPSSSIQEFLSNADKILAWLNQN